MSLSYEQRVLKVLSWIHDNPSADLSLDSLADIALMSRFHWHRVFQAMTGETCAQAVRRIRLYRASTWLIRGDLPVAEIAAAVGYPNVQSFNRAFKEAFAAPPAMFRKMGKPGLPVQFKTKGSFTMFKVDIENAPQRRLAALQHEGAYTEVGKCFEQLAAIASAENLWSQVRGMVGVHYHDPNVVSEAELRSHAGLLVADELQIPNVLEQVMLQAGPCAVLHYKGPYSAIKVAYDYFYGDWLPKSGREPADLPPYEIYLNSPGEVEEAALLTDIVVRLVTVH